MITLALITTGNIYAIQLPRPHTPAPLGLLLLALALAVVGLTLDVVLSSAIIGAVALPFCIVALGLTIGLGFWEVIRL